MYMFKKPKGKPKAIKLPKAKAPPLRWRPNCLRFWREYRGNPSQEAVVEALSRPPYSINYTYASLGRVERGEQMPPINVIEALASLYETDVDSLINRRPELTADVADPDSPASAKLILHLWDRATADERRILVGMALRMGRKAAS